LKNRGIFLFLPLFLPPWRVKDKMNSSGIECEACLVHLKRIKGESD